MQIVQGEHELNDANVICLVDHFTQVRVTRLNNETGLNFNEAPESLLGQQEEWEAFAEILLGRAMTFWEPGAG